MIESIFEVYPEQSLATMPLGISVDGLIYGRGLDGADPVSGEISRLPEEQMRSAVSKLKALIEGAGGDASSIRRISAVHQCPDVAGLFEAAWRELFPGVDRPAFAETPGHLSPGRLLELDCYAAVSGSQANDGGIEALSACPDDAGGPAGARLGPIVFGRLTAMEPCTGRPRGDDLESQLRHVLENMALFLGNAGAGLNEVAHVTLFMRPTDLSIMNLVWSALYPDPADRPPHKWVPAALPEGHFAAADVIAVPGAAGRRVIEIENARHGDPMTMAALTGNLVTSSRVIATRREDPADYARQIFDNIEEIMARAGGSIESLTQLTAFVGLPEYRLLVEGELTRRLGANEQRPVVHYVEANLGGVKAPRIALLGLV